MPGVGRQFDFDRFPEAQRGGLRVYQYGGITSGCAISSAKVGADQKSVVYEVAAGNCVLDGKSFAVAAATDTSGSGGSDLSITVPFVPEDDALFSYKGKIYRNYRNTYNNRGGVFTDQLPAGIFPVTLHGPVIRAKRSVPAITQAEYDTAVADTNGLKGLYLTKTGVAAVGSTQSGDYQKCAKFVVVSPVIKGQIAGYLDATEGHQEVIAFVRCTDSSTTKGVWEAYNPIFDEPPSNDYLNLPFNSILGAYVAPEDECQIWNKVASTIMHVRMGAAKMREPAGLLLGQLPIYYVSNRASADYGKLCNKAGTVYAAAANILSEVKIFAHAYNTPDASSVAY